MVFFWISENIKNQSFPMFWGGIEREQWHAIIFPIMSKPVNWFTMQIYWAGFAWKKHRTYVG